MTKFWMQVQAPAGNWADSVGTHTAEDAIGYAQSDVLTGGAKARVVERTDREVWPSPQVEPSGCPITAEARRSFRLLDIVWAACEARELVVHSGRIGPDGRVHVTVSGSGFASVEVEAVPGSGHVELVGSGHLVLATLPISA